MNIINAIRKFADIIIHGYSGGGIIYMCGDEVLMQLRRHPPVWSFVGGGFDRLKDSTLVDTAIREFWEETGIHLDRDHLMTQPVHALGFWHYRWELYLYCANQKESVSNAPASFRSEYEKYRYVNLYHYKSDLSKERHKRTYPFVSYQIKKVQKYLNRKII